MQVRGPLGAVESYLWLTTVCSYSPAAGKVIVVLLLLFLNKTFNNQLILCTQNPSLTDFLLRLILTYPQAPQRECPRGWMRSATCDMKSSVVLEWVFASEMPTSASINSRPRCSPSSISSGYNTSVFLVACQEKEWNVLCCKLIVVLRAGCKVFSR